MRGMQRTRPDWQGHYQIAAKLWNVLYCIFSMIVCPKLTLGNLGDGLPLQSSFEGFHVTAIVNSSSSILGTAIHENIYDEQSIDT